MADDNKMVAEHPIVTPPWWTPELHVRLVNRCGRIRIALREELEKLESGKMQTHDVVNGLPAESTVETASRIKGWINELDQILAQHEKK